jgi:hypothetical protein
MFPDFTIYHSDGHAMAHPDICLPSFVTKVKFPTRRSMFPDFTIYHSDGHAMAHPDICLPSFVTKAKLPFRRSMFPDFTITLMDTLWRTLTFISLSLSQN